MFMRSVLAALAALLPLATPAAAQVPDQIATAEILDGWRAEDGRHMTALRITLAPGWKTYWRAPGDAGIPPVFDWSGSDNAARIALSYPLPNVFELGGFRSIGYYDEAVFPIAVVPETPGVPIRLTADMMIGVCEEVCVPLALTATAVLDAAAVSPTREVREAMANRPMTAREAGIGEVACSVDFIEDGLRVVARMELPPLGREEIAVVEYDAPGIWVSEPKLVRDGDRLEAHVDLVPTASEPFAYFRDETRITIFGGGKAVEIDGCG